MKPRKLNIIDSLLIEVDQSLRVIHAKAPISERKNPADDIKGSDLTDDESLLSARLMRVNHAGEVSAQGLYRGQAMMSKSTETRQQMKISADEENDHLNWCESRLEQLNSHKSYFNPIWYIGSFGIGAIAGLAGDKWSLGFVKETEDQVGKHIELHLEKLPENDEASRVVLEQMKLDEAHHAEVAVQAGAVELPLPVRKFVMPFISKVMTTVSARI